MMRTYVVLVLAVSAAVLAGCGKPGNPAAEKAAVAAAEAWLKLIDDGQYAECWDEAAPFFRAAVPKDKWTEQMTAFRKPFGNRLSRKVTRREYRTAMPGAPDGEYVVIQFQASFEHKQNAVETVTPMKETDGTWRVSGYYIR